MPAITLASLITSVAKSLEDANSKLNENKIAVELEEFECSLTLQVSVDIDALEGAEEIPGLKFLDVRGAKPIKRPPSAGLTALEQVEDGTFTMRVVVSPTPYE